MNTDAYLFGRLHRDRPDRTPACPGRMPVLPVDRQLPKSYLREEQGAARAFQNNFDPYLQEKSRHGSYLAIGHPTDKIELLILGGSWSALRFGLFAHGSSGAA